MLSNKKYWLKGGLIVVGLIVFIYVSSSFLGENNPFRREVGMIFMLAAPTFVLIAPIVSLFDWEFAFIMFVLSAFVSWFFIGAILGWLYGKIKNKKQ